MHIEEDIFPSCIFGGGWSGYHGYHGRVTSTERRVRLKVVKRLILLLTSPELLAFMAAGQKGETTEVSDTLKKSNTILQGHISKQIRPRPDNTQ